MTLAGIAVEDVWLARESVEVLRGVTLAVPAQEVVAIVGPSGSGKTTLLRVILGLVRPDRGRVRLRGDEVTHGRHLLRPPEERRLGMVFQDLALWPHLTVEGNLGFGLEAQGVAPDERERRIDEMLRRVGLLGHKKRRPGSLSGGERQRVAIARALVLEPDAVLLDEPLSNVDVGLKRELVALFSELLRERAITALYVTHDPRDAAAVGHRIAVMEHGSIVQAGTIDDLAVQPATPFVELVLSEVTTTNRQND